MKPSRRSAGSTLWLSTLVWSDSLSVKWLRASRQSRSSVSVWCFSPQLSLLTCFLLLLWFVWSRYIYIFPGNTISWPLPVTSLCLRLLEEGERRPWIYAPGGDGWQAVCLTLLLIDRRAAPPPLPPPHKQSEWQLAKADAGNLKRPGKERRGRSLTHRWNKYILTNSSDVINSFTTFSLLQLLHPVFNYPHPVIHPARLAANTSLQSFSLVI